MKKDWNDFPFLESTTPFDIDLFKYYCDTSSSIIDVGCGYGRICKILENNDYHNITGIDSSSVLLDRAKQNLKFTTLILSDGLCMPFNSNSFEHAIAFGIINCLINIDDFIKFIKEIDRIINIGGYFFVNDYTRNDSEYFDNKYDTWFKEFKIKRVFKAKSGLIFRHYSIAEMLNVFDPYFDLIWCKKRKLLSFNHTHYVNGYSMIFQKIKFKSRFR